MHVGLHALDVCRPTWLSFHVIDASRTITRHIITWKNTHARLDHVMSCAATHMWHHMMSHTGNGNVTCINSSMCVAPHHHIRFAGKTSWQFGLVTFLLVCFHCDFSVFICSLSVFFIHFHTISMSCNDWLIVMVVFGAVSWFCRPHVFVWLCLGGEKIGNLVTFPFHDRLKKGNIESFLHHQKSRTSNSTFARTLPLTVAGTVLSLLATS